MVILFTARKVSITQTILIIAALLGRIVTAWLLSSHPTCLVTLIHSCNIISLINGFGSSPVKLRLERRLVGLWRLSGGLG